VTNVKTCECTDNWHSLKEPLIRPTRDGKNNLTRQLRKEKSEKSTQIRIRNNA